MGDRLNFPVYNSIRALHISYNIYSIKKCTCTNNNKETRDAPIIFFVCVTWYWYLALAAAVMFSVLVFCHVSVKHGWSSRILNTRHSSNRFRNTAVRKILQSLFHWSLCDQEGTEFKWWKINWLIWLVCFWVVCYSMYTHIIKYCHRYEASFAWSMKPPPPNIYMQ